MYPFSALNTAFYNEFLLKLTQGLLLCNAHLSSCHGLCFIFFVCSGREIYYISTLSFCCHFTSSYRLTLNVDHGKINALDKLKSLPFGTATGKMISIKIYIHTLSKDILCKWKLKLKHIQSTRFRILILLVLLT